MQIPAITPEQEARLQEWRDKWIGIGFSTEPADFDKATKAALKAYDLHGLKRPTIILRMSSPYGAAVGAAMARCLINKTSRGVVKPCQVGYQVRQRDWLRLWDQAEQQIERALGDRAWYRVGKAVYYRVQALGQQVWEQLWQQVDHRVRHPIDPRDWHPLDQQVRQQVLQQIGCPIGRRSWHKIERQLWRQLSVSARKETNNYYIETLSLPGCAYVTLLRDVFGWRNPLLESFSIEEDLATSCNWVSWHKDILAIGDRPSEIHLDAQRRLHNESGPSIVYRDGWKLYHIHGVAVPAFVVEQPEHITVAHIESELDTEVRHVMVSRMGLDRFIRESGLKPIHSDDFGTLYHKRMPGDEPFVVVKVVNSTPNPDGSRKEYFLRVPPTMKRAREAVAWTFGMEEKEYRPATET